MKDQLKAARGEKGRKYGVEGCPKGEKRRNTHCGKRGSAAQQDSDIIFQSGDLAAMFFCHYRGPEARKETGANHTVSRSPEYR